MRSVLDGFFEVSFTGVFVANVANSTANSAMTFGAELWWRRRSGLLGGGFVVCLENLANGAFTGERIRPGQARLVLEELVGPLLSLVSEISVNSGSTQLAATGGAQGSGEFHIKGGVVLGKHETELGGEKSGAFGDLAGLLIEQPHSAIAPTGKLLVTNLAKAARTNMPPSVGVRRRVLSHERNQPQRLTQTPSHRTPRLKLTLTSRKVIDH